MITRQDRERKQEAMKKWNQEILKMNQKKINEERRLRELQRQKLEEIKLAQEEEKKHMQLEERKVKELNRQKLEELKKAQEKVKEERDRRFQENERRKKEVTKKKLQEAAKVREDEKSRRDLKKQLAEEQRDQDEQRRIDEEISRWRREEYNRRCKEERCKVTIDDQVKLESQRQRVEEVMRMSKELAFKGTGRTEKNGKLRAARVGDSSDSEDEDGSPTFTTEFWHQSDEEETSKENQQDQLCILERSQQELEEESRREAQHARYKRYQEERQCRTLEDDLHKLMQKATALANLVDDAESVGTLDDLNSHDSYDGKTERREKEKSIRGKRGASHAKRTPLCADQKEGMTYLYNRLEEEKRKQLLVKKPKARKSKRKDLAPLPKNIGLPYSKSLGNSKPPRGVLEPIPFLKYDGSPCFGHGRNYVIKR